MHEMLADIRSIKERREEMAREVAQNRLAKSLRKNDGREKSRAASFARKLDFIRLVGVFGRSGKVRKRRAL